MKGKDPRKDKLRIKNSAAAIKAKVRIIQKISDILKEEGFAVNDISLRMATEQERFSNAKKKVERENRKRGLFIKGQLQISFDNYMEYEQLHNPKSAEEESGFDDDYDTDFKAGNLLKRGSQEGMKPSRDFDDD